MESLGGFCDGEWESFSALFTSQELEQSPFAMVDNAGCKLHNSDSSSWFYSLDAFDPNLQSCSSCSTTTDNSSGSSFLFVNSNNDLFLSSIDDDSNFGSSFLSDVFMDEVVDTPLAAAGEHCGPDKLIGRSHPPLPPPLVDDYPVAERKPIALKRKAINNENFSHNQNKKTQVSAYAQKKKKKGMVMSVEEEGNAAVASQGQSSTSSYSSEEENGSPEANGGFATTSGGGKTRASRGSATDPQSLYARKRRERINERLKILQKLVPNGTKVDISTMLEEAVHYVKFLQLQIQLLSSDELWMFAPLAYNGLDLGLHHKLSPFLSH